MGRRTTEADMRPRIAALATLGLVFALLGCGDDEKQGALDADTEVAAPDTTTVDSVAPQDSTEVQDGSDALDTLEDVAPDPVAELIAQGKAYLAQARPVDALSSFEAALAIAPDNTDALFGAALAELIDASEMMSMVLTLAGQAAGMQIYFLDPPPSQNEWAAEEIHKLFMDLRLKFEKPLGRLELIYDRELHFEVESAWLYLGIHPRLNYHGVFDRGDVHLMGAIANFAVFMLDVLAGQDLTTDVFTAISLARGLCHFRSVA